MPPCSSRTSVGPNRDLLPTHTLAHTHAHIHVYIHHHLSPDLNTTKDSVYEVVVEFTHLSVSNDESRHM